jgi:DNA/RNA-binding domain of Phe-tRNA-synthetase-like protein
MPPAAAAGDLALSARVAAPETFAPYGRLLGPGDRVHLAQRGGALLVLDRAQPGPRRITYLQRYPEARRVLLPLGPGSLLLVVLGPGERPGGPPAAFLVPHGQGVLIKEGVWHAGPVPLEELPVCEVLETSGSVDRMDRRPLRDLIGAEGVRVLLPEEPGARPPGLDLTQPNSVLLDAGLHGRLRLGCLDLRDLEVGESDAGLAAEAERLSEAMRSTYGAMGGIEEVPGVAETRALFRDVGIDPERIRPSSEALVALALEGRPPLRVNALVDTLHLCSLKTRVPMSAYDAQRLAEQVLVRSGGPGEAFPGLTRQRVSVEGRPVLCDREGAFGGPVGDALRTRVTHQTRRALVVLFLPARSEPGGADRLLTIVASEVLRRCQGREAARLVVG